MTSFWNSLPKPFFALAPLEDVTDAAFRRLIAKYGKPHVMFTEFTSADGLVLADEKGQKRLRKKLIYSESERPIAAQLFSAVPEYMERAARLVAEFGFDGVDINMGCPVAEVVRQECGAALIKNPRLARELIRAAKKSGLPVSVKTRIGYNEDELDTWLPELLTEEPAAITIHARTRKEMSEVPAQWGAVARAVLMRNAASVKTLILGNGDVKDLVDARKKVEETNCDGVMLGRAIFGNPWLFADVAHAERGCNIEHPAPIAPPSDRNSHSKIARTEHLASQSRNRPKQSECDADRLFRAIGAGVPTPQQKIKALAEHLSFFEELLRDTTNYATMKKHFKAYVSGWPDSKELRVKLMETESPTDARQLLGV